MEPGVHVADLAPSDEHEPSGAAALLEALREPGQVLLEAGRPEEALAPLRKAVATVLQIGGVDGLQARAPQAQRRGADG